MILAADIGSVASATAVGIIWAVMALAGGMLWNWLLIPFIAIAVFVNYGMIQDYQHGIRMPLLYHAYAFLGFNCPLVVSCFLCRKYHRWIPREERLQLGLCINCRYDLTGNVSGVCPECGEAVPEGAISDQQSAVRDW